MSATYLRLAEKPALHAPPAPSCGACAVEVDCTGDEWLCPSCGTTWSLRSVEHPAEDAMLYEEWAGEPLEGPVCPNDLAWRVSTLKDIALRDETIRHLLEQGVER